MMMSTTSLCAHSGGRFMDELGLPCWVSQRLSFSKCLDMFLGISHGFLLKQHERHHDHDHDGCVLSAWLMAWGQPSEHSVTSFCPDPFCLAWWMDYHEHFQHLGISPAKSQQEELELHYEKVTGSTDSKACQRSLNDY